MKLMILLEEGDEEIFYYDERVEEDPLPLAFDLVREELLDAWRRWSSDPYERALAE